MRSPSLSTRVLAAVAVVVVLLLGLWVTGGLITNDFALAMWLSAGWMALAGVAALLVAVRARSFRWPVLAAYAVTAAVVGAYLGSSVLFDEEVSEQVATATPSRAANVDGGATKSDGRPPPRNVELRAGSFESVRHQASGKATFIGLAEGGRVLTLTDFTVDNGPDLRVYLVAGDPTTEAHVEDFVDIGALEGNEGDQQYELPDGVDIDRYSTVVVWCRAFSVLFAKAPTEP